MTPEQREAVRGGLQDLPGHDWHGPVAPGYSAVFSGLDRELPLLLLPVRLETRFLPPGAPTELVVRIFPDDVQTDLHVPALEQGEVDHGIAFWRAAWPPGVTRDVLDPMFARMASRLGACRAAWVLELTRPLDWFARPASGPPLMIAHFPTPPLRDAVEPGRARLLPDRWVVTGYQHDEQVFLVAGAPITDDLPATPDLAAVDAAPRSTLALMDAQGMTWLHDLDAAESAGMAVRVPLGTWDVEAGIDLFVVGVRGTAGAGASAVADLLAAHHWTRGLDLLRRGVPTNNADDAPAGYSATAPDLVALLDTVLTPSARPGPAKAAARSAPGPPGGVDLPGGGLPTMPAAGFADRSFSSALTLALGLGEDTIVGRLPHAQDSQLQLAGAMNAALWPAAWGHFLRSLLAPAVGEAGIGWVRERYARHVAGGGPLPALRIGRQPYGVLPVAVDRVEPAATPEQAALTRVLLALLPSWDNAVAEWVPRLDPDATDVTGGQPAGGGNGPRLTLESATTTLARILGAVPNPGDLAVRAASDDTEAYLDAYNSANVLLILTLGNSTQAAIDLYNTLPDAATLEEQIAVFEAMVLALPDGDPFAEFIKTYLLYGGSRVDDNGDEVYFSGVLQGQDERTLPLLGHDFGVNRTRVTGRIESTGEPKSFFTTFADSATPWTAPLVADAAVGEDVAGWLAELVTEAADPSRPAAAPGEHPSLLFQLLKRALAVAHANDRSDAVAGLRTLANAAADGRLADPAELETLLGEALGTCMNRIDAWLCGAAVSRLETMRAARPHGLEIGGFGWALGLRPASVAGASQGFVHAPDARSRRHRGHLAQRLERARRRHAWRPRARGGSQLRSGAKRGVDRGRDARWLPAVRVARPGSGAPPP